MGFPALLFASKCAPTAGMTPLCIRRHQSQTNNGLPFELPRELLLDKVGIDESWRHVIALRSRHIDLLLTVKLSHRIKAP